MPKLVKGRSQKTGLAPGALIHIGEKKSERTRITAVEYDDQNFQENELTLPEGGYPFKKEPTVRISE